ncbi:tRNA preQ1(34) S-adenosylmethionine ribosyltransferase-isomerase QueA [bacterium]|nr:tRNA preQ1(34) S-adenosylmethionine ribosyltransferase-isomerase QueA [bacterium]QQR60238.1 MAG: tRNA preQ1(34) S-adenosylmethionine ribosyltransferase-isomerase QueA [Candidatus Melainabacteria bacterium]
MKLEDLDYDLPKELIAHEPLPVRHESRLLVANRKTREIKHEQFGSIKEYLKPGDVLVVNNTKVLAAHLLMKRKTGGTVDLLFLRALPEMGAGGKFWEAMGRPIKRLHPGEVLEVTAPDGTVFSVTIHGFMFAEKGERRLVIDLSQAGSAYEFFSKVGFAPLPPYILSKRSSLGELKDSFDRESDIDRYQTVFAEHPGAIAAPTAGLHFSDELLSELKANGVHVQFVTLHVGAGTFKLIESSVEDHKLESEQFYISKETKEVINAAKARGSRVVAVGTTSLRALESAAVPASESGTEYNTIRSVDGENTSLYVKPGHEFLLVDSMITNFHLARSSLLVLVATFADKELILDAYNQAVERKYRFFSYGDAMLIL